MTQTTTRYPAVAGMFYPDDPDELHQQIQDYLSQSDLAAEQPSPLALIVPHAGYIYSGEVAAKAYARIQPLAKKINRVILLGPSHRVAFNGLAVPSARQFSTPLGNIPVDRASIKQILAAGSVVENDAAHLQEHSLEVQLPFLQEVLEEFVLLPIVVGHVEPQQIADLLDDIWHDSHTLLVISSDLSHFHDYATAQAIDQRTTNAIETLHPEAISHEDACGGTPVNGLLYLAKRRGLKVETIDLRNSGDTAGDHDRVVGYGAYIFTKN